MNRASGWLVQLLGTLVSKDVYIMKTLGLSLVVSSLALVAASGWVPASKADEVKTLAVSELRTVLKEFGEVEEQKDDEDKTFFLVKGKEDVNFLVFQYGGKGDLSTSISITAPFEVKADLEALNAFNRDTRFVKAYQADEDTVMLESDLDLSVAPSKASVEKFVKTFVSTVKTFKED